MRRFTVRFLNPQRRWMPMKAFDAEMDAVVHLDRKLENMGVHGLLFAIFEGRRKLWDTRELQIRAAGG